MKPKWLPGDWYNRSVHGTTPVVLELRFYVQYGGSDSGRWVTDTVETIHREGKVRGKGVNVLHLRQGK